MNTSITMRATELHRKAMEMADEADSARRLRNLVAARPLLLEAAQYEAESASLITDEPSRSVLYRSAASLALEGGEARRAEQLVACALAGAPPDEIADELRDLLEQIHFARHLALRGITLDEEEFQMSIAGEAVGFGMAPSERFIRRIEDIQRLIYRTAERTSGQPFRDVSTAAKVVRRELEVFVTVPRASSLAITFRLGRPNNQELLVARIRPAHILNEVLTCLSLLNEGQERLLRERIDDEPYFRNFISIAKQIAPDGAAITTVGFTASPDASGKAQLVAFRRLRSSIATVRPDMPAARRTEYRGRLLMADERNPSSGKIRVVDSATNLDQPIHVPAGMMADVVRPLWGAEVVATCSQNGKRATLIDVQRADEAPPPERRARTRRRR